MLSADQAFGALNPARVFQGLTAQQEAYAMARFNGLRQIEAYRLAYDKQGDESRDFYNDASALDRNPKIVARVRQLMEEDQGVTNLFPKVSDALVTNGILSIAMLGEKESNRLNAWVHLGKMAGIDLFRETTRVEHINRTPEDVEKELKAKLQDLMVTIEGKAKPQPLEPSQRRDRRRKPAPK